MRGEIDDAILIELGLFDGSFGCSQAEPDVGRIGLEVFGDLLRFLARSRQLREIFADGGDIDLRAAIEAGYTAHCELLRARGFREYGIGECDYRLARRRCWRATAQDFEARNRGQDRDRMRADEPIHLLEALAAGILRNEELRRQAGQCAIRNDRKSLLGGDLFAKWGESLLINFIGERGIEPLARINDPCPQGAYLLAEVAG